MVAAAAPTTSMDNTMHQLECMRTLCCLGSRTVRLHPAIHVQRSMYRALAHCEVP
jgi:hypothetical protein